MKQPFLFFSILISLFICFSCEQLPQETEEAITQNETEDKNTNSNFMASMRNLKYINTYIEASNQQLVASIETTATTKTQYQPLVATAVQIQDLTTKFHQYIDALKDLVAQESNGVYTQFDAETKGNIDLIGMPKDGGNKEVIEQVFITGQYGGVNTQEQQGPALFYKLMVLRKDYLDLVANHWNDGGIQGTIFANGYKKEAYLTQVSDNFLLKDYNNPSKTTKWVEENFKDKTTEEAYILLTEKQTQVNLSTAAVLKFLSEQMGKLELNYDKFDVFAQSPKPYVLLGETYEAEIALGAYSTQANFSVSVGGRALSIVDGKARYSAKASRVGEQSYNAKISVKNPLTGEIKTFTKSFKYEVEQPSIMVTVDKRNILYIGVENPIAVVVAGIAGSSFKISMTGGALKKTSSTGYVALVTKPGEAIITVKDLKTEKSFPFKFRVKRIPNPFVKLGDNIDGTMGSGEFKAQPGLKAVLENFEYDGQCQVQSYNLTYTRKRQDAIVIKGKGGRFAGEVRKAVHKAKPGDQYAFTEVKVRCPGDKAGRRVNGLSFRIK